MQSIAYLRSAFLLGMACGDDDDSDAGTETPTEAHDQRCNHDHRGTINEDTSTEVGTDEDTSTLSDVGTPTNADTDIGTETGGTGDTSGTDSD
jgi:hypothetical protein